MDIFPDVETLRTLTDEERIHLNERLDKRLCDLQYNNRNPEVKQISAYKKKTLNPFMEGKFDASPIEEYCGINDGDIYERLARLKIQKKSGEIVLFVINEGQRMVVEAYVRMKMAGLPIRIKVLKCRQWGASTIATALIYLDQLENVEKNAMIISNKDKSALWITGIYNRFWRYSDQQLRPEGRFSRDGFQFKAGGSMMCVPARFYDSALSQTRQDALFDECAFYPDYSSFLGAAMQVIPKLPSSMIFKVTTPHGFQSDFHKDWKKDNDGYEKVFVPWHILSEYSTPFINEEERETFDETFGKLMDDYGDEEEVKSRFNLNVEQMNWRRHKIDEDCQGRVDTFKWMYPADEKEGFLGGGRKFFWFSMADHWTLAEQTKKKTTRWEPEYEYDDLGLVCGCKIVMNSTGRFLVKELPVDGVGYVIGVDSAGGKLVDDYMKESDRSVIQILKRGMKDYKEVCEQVGIFAGHIEPYLLGWVSYAVSEWYNKAWMVIESNNHGHTVIDHAKIKGESRLMEDPAVTEKAIFDVTKTPKYPVYGINMSPKMRMPILDELARGLKEKDLLLFDEETLNECDTFLIDEKGRPEAQSGCFDDRVMSLAIAFAAHTKRWIPIATFKTESEVKLGGAIDEMRRLIAMKEGDFDPQTGFYAVPPMV
jgi:hypothetical protein